MKNTIIFDLDGTLALIDGRRDHALKMGKNGKMNWNEFFNPANIAFDKPNEPVIKMAQLFSQQGFKIVILSGRSDKMFDRTVEWLEWNDVPFDKLVMRDSKTNHFTPDDVLKKDMLDKHVDINDVFLVVDDRDRVVKLWRSLGLTTFQVADGDF
tara:strand:+ start:624 stop:1085 length:462 start_codon:yes stop_codon:yes gene_type:complete